MNINSYRGIGIELIYCFVVLAEVESFSKAAHNLDIQQGALSEKIKRLETILKVTLHRPAADRKRNIELTEAGRQLLPYAKRMLEELDEAYELLVPKGDLSNGRVAIGAPPVVGSRLLPSVLALFNENYPGIKLRLYETGSGNALTLLKGGTIELAIVSGRPETMKSTELLTEDLVIAVAENHPLAGRKQIEAVELREERFILFPEGYELRERTKNFCAKAGFEPNIVLDGGEMYSVLSLAASGLGIAIVPQRALRKGDGLEGLRVHNANLRRTLYLAWHPDRYLPPAGKALRSFLTEQLQERL